MSVGVIVVLGAFILGLGLLVALPSPVAAPTVFGVSFSAPHATGIGLNWREAYQAVLYDLGVKRLRLGAYWNDIEKHDDVFDFTDLDYQLDEAEKAGAKVILTVGRKVQRWPECHEPDWIKNSSEVEKQQEILEMLGIVISRYRQHPALYMWQLENEPFLEFGLCPPSDNRFLDQEEVLMRSLDIAHPILITDSGELNWWWAATAYGDVLGTTMYRTVFSSRTQRLFSYDYIFPAWLYRAKSRVINLGRGKKVLISELQGEPWGAQPFTQMSDEERRSTLPLERLRQLHYFAQRTQLPEAYWWGVEYWYWEKEIKGNPAYWHMARSFFRYD